MVGPVLVQKSSKQIFDKERDKKLIFLIFPKIHMKIIRVSNAVFQKNAILNHNIGENISSTVGLF